MTYEAIATMIKEVGVPTAYYQFPEGTGQEPPFICFYYPENRGFFADNAVYAKEVSLTIELYTREKRFDLEDALESVLAKYEIPFVRYESYIDSEKLYMQTYEMEVFINGRDQ